MINVQKDRITYSQMLILVWGLSLVLGVAFFYLVVDHALDSKVLDLLGRVEVVEGQLKWMRQTINSVEDPRRVLDYFNEMDRNLDRKFPDTAEKSLLMLTDYGNKFGVRVERVQPEKKLKVVSARGGSLGAEGKVCYGVQVSMKFKGEYQNLVKYLDALRKVVPAFVVVRNISIDNKFSSTPKLEGNLDLSLYLLE